MEKKKKTTLKDIARAADVSVSTVSRVFSGKAKISNDTTEKIYSIARDMNFNIRKFTPEKEVPSLAFLAYFQRQSSYDNSFFLNAMHGAYEYCREKGFSLQIHFCEEKDQDKEILTPLIDKNLIDGAILSTVYSQGTLLDSLKEKNFPFSVIGRPEDTSRVIWVDNDNFNAAYSIAHTLFNQGHTRIAYVGRDLDYHFALDRYNGYLQAYKTRGLDIPGELCLINNKPEWRTVLQNFLSTHTFDAILIDDDEMGREVLSLLNELNSSVKIIRFNYIPYPDLYSNNLKMLDIKPRELGFWAAKLLIDYIKGEGEITSRVIPIDVNS